MIWQMRRIAIVWAMCLFGFAPPVRAHCDTLVGPVVTAARVALERREVTPVLIWVKGPQEEEVRQTFQKTIAVRGLSAAARELADRYFFETVVRLHRAGEGEPFTGLKDTGETDEALESADRALATGLLDPVVKLVTERAAAGVRERFARVREAQATAGTSVAAGRRYVEAYVEFIHYVERVYEATTATAHGHFDETEPAAHDR